ncbi:MAG: response regulator [Spirochaetes bacterium]|nr:response regulator [Spirochaetota bacterium]
MKINEDNLILMIDDSAEDYEFAKKSFHKAGLNSVILHINNGKEGLDYLLRRGKYAAEKEKPLPRMILLDINMPDMDGLEVLKAVKQDRNLQVIPVIMLSSSVEGKDIKQAYELGADSYIAKPVSINGLFRAIEMLKNYWFEIVVLRKPMTLIE